MWAHSPGQIATHQGAWPSHRNKQDLRTGAGPCHFMLPTASVWVSKFSAKMLHGTNQTKGRPAIKKMRWMSHMQWGVNGWGWHWSQMKAPRRRKIQDAGYRGAISDHCQQQAFLFWSMSSLRCLEHGVWILKKRPFPHNFSSALASHSSGPWLLFILQEHLFLLLIKW